MNQSDKVGTIFLNAPGPEAEAYARGLLGEVAERFEFVQIAKATSFAAALEAESRGAFVAEPDTQPIWAS